jgi:hypothetical protein
MDSLTEGYRGEECRSEYGDTEQRWLVVYSEAEERAREKVQKEHKEEAKAFSKLTGREFACREDAEQALEEFESGLKASEFTETLSSRMTHVRLSAEIRGTGSSPPGEIGHRQKNAHRKKPHHRLRALLPALVAVGAPKAVLGEVQMQIALGDPRAIASIFRGAYTAHKGRFHFVLKF